MATATKVSEEAIDAELASARLEKKTIERLRKFTKQAIARGGVQGIREGSATWDKAERAVIRDLLQHELTVASVEENEE